MQVIPRCRSISIIRNFLNFSSNQFASFHSTPVYYDKWKSKWKSDGKSSQKPAKDWVRYTTRQKRADTKRALKTLLSHYGGPGTTFQNDELSWRVPGDKDCESGSIRKRRPKSETNRPQKIHNHKMRRKYRKGYSSEDDDYPETTFQATFGDRHYTWRSNRNGSSRRSTPKFDWRETFQRTKVGQEEWERVNEPDSEDELCKIGLPSDRALLGLPLHGRLKMEDVKTAFHLSALKWHPDKHQGPSQAAAEEKFKLCVNAYKSLCSALSEA